MLKLLLKKDRKNIRQEYLLRFWIVIVFSLVLLLIVWGSLLSASFVQVKVDKKIALDQLGNLENTTDGHNRAVLIDVSESVEEKMAQLQNMPVQLVEIIDVITNSQPSGIILDSISVNVSPAHTSSEGVPSAELRGIAETRDDLVEFQKILLDKPIVLDAQIPYSSFTKNTNVPFTINIALDVIELDKIAPDNVAPHNVAPKI